jgi:TonB-linked SusC/RagA family outer membrane protein
MKKLLQSLFILLFIATSAMAQERTVTGKVTAEEDGLPIPGVTVKIKGVERGTISSATGTFSLKAPAGDLQLEFTSIGFTSITKSLSAGNNTLTVVLENDSRVLNDVIVTGYGSGRRISSTVGSVATVSAKVVENKPTANAFDALQGKVAGLQVFTSSGEPSATSSLRLHGVGSLGASSTPLYLLDGIQVAEATIISLNPNDIESVSVLKDASSTSIYGSRAANGVLYITTKKGNTNQPARITVQSQYSVSNNAHDDFYKNVFNTKELTDFWVKTGYRTQAQVNTTLAANPNDTKWYDYYMQTNAPVFQQDLSVSGGSGKTSYYISGSYFKGEGLAYRSGFERYTLRSNINTAVNDYINFGMNLSAGTNDTETNQYGSNSLNRGLALLAQPFYSPNDANGNEIYEGIVPGLGRYNPKYLADKLPYNLNRLQFNPSAFIDIHPIKNLTLRSQGGLDGSIVTESSATLPSFVGGLYNGSAAETFDREIQRTLTNTIEYKFNIDKHNFTVLGGQEYIDYDRKQTNASTTGLADDRLLGLGNGTGTRTVGSSKSEYVYKSIFSRVEYNYADKYFLDGSLRQDKSSRFGIDNKDATFWSVGAMWRAKQETFLKDVSWLDDITLRASTGTSGNSSIGNYESLATVGGNQYNGAAGFGLSAPGNPLLGWESQRKTTIGIKSSLFNRVRLDLEFYHRVTSNQLVSVPYALTTGWASVRTNVGALQNTGLDVTLDFDILPQSSPLSITPYLNANFNKNKITELFQGKNYWIVSGTGVSWAIGEPVSFFYPMFKGVNSETGNPEWYLPNTGDGIINTRNDPNAITNTFSEAGLQQNTGIERYPWLNGGFGFNSEYKGLFMNVDFTFSQGKYLINNDRYFFENPNQFAGYNQSRTVADYWTTPGQNATFPRYGVQFTQFDDRLIENASFIRLKTLQVGYNLPQSILKQTKVIKGARVFFVGRNLLTFTEYTGPDPEADSNLSLGVNPNTKQVGFGLQLTF